MTFLKKIIKYYRKEIKKLKLVEIYLIVIMIILLAQSIGTLFFPTQYEATYDRIDVVLRTTMASIFGYFVSSKTLGQSKSEEINKPPTINNSSKEHPQIQINIIGCLCIFSIIILLLIRYFVLIEDTALGYFALYRDFVSGCIGFLVGMPNKNKLN